MNHIRGFLGNVPVKSEPVHVVGIGISGLLMGWYLRKNGYSVTLYGNTEQAGGMIHSISTDYGLVETAANGIIWSPVLQQLCQDLNLKPIAARPEASKRFILRKGKFKTFPLSAWETLRIMPSLLRSVPVSDTENLEEFARKVGGFPLYNFIVQAGLYGIYASEARHLGLKAIFPGVHARLSRGNSVWDAIRSIFPSKPKPGMPKGMHSFPKGMDTLTQALAESLKPNIQPLSSLPEGDPYSQYIFCTPSWADLPEWVPENLRQKLKQVQYAPLVSATWFFPSDALRYLPAGFGAVIPPSEGRLTLGILFNDQIFDHRVTSPQYRSFTTIAGGYGRPLDLTTLPEAEIADRVGSELKEILGITCEPLEFRVNVWKKALPVYSPELPGLWAELQDELTQSPLKINLFGNYTGEISIRGLCTVASQVAGGKNG